MPDKLDPVASHYNRFPFPTVKSFTVPQPCRFKGDSLNFLLSRREKNWLAGDIDIWIAGCGTQQALHWAMCFPKARIIATDISKTALKIAESFAQQLNVDNIKFELLDIGQQCFKNDFDLIICTGVLHHISSPESGLVNVRTALKRNGAALIMLYNRMHREPLKIFRDAHKLLSQDNENESSRYDLAITMLEELSQSDKLQPPLNFEPSLSSTLDNLLEVYNKDKSLVADALLQPREISFDIDELFKLIESSGFKHSAWLEPRLWELSTYTTNKELLSRFKKLDNISKYKAIYNLAGYASPMFSFLVEHVDLPKSKPYSESELIDMPVLFNSSTQTVCFDSGSFIKSESANTYKIKENKIIGNVNKTGNTQSFWQLPACAEELLVACDGKTTIRELYYKFDTKFSKEEIYETLYKLLPDKLGLITLSLS